MTEMRQEERDNRCPCGSGRRGLGPVEMMELKRSGSFDPRYKTLGYKSTMKIVMARIAA